MEGVPFITALTRIAALVPLVLFFYRQGTLHAKNGDVGRVRRATLGVALFTILMFGNLVWVNLRDAFTPGAGNQVNMFIAMLSATGMATCLWYTYWLFCKIQSKQE